MLTYHINAMLRTSKVHYKSSELYPILRAHFGKSMNLARIKALGMMVCALCKVRRVTYTNWRQHSTEMRPLDLPCRESSASLPSAR